MKKVLLTIGLISCLVSSAIASSFGINIAPSIGYFKKNLGIGVELGVGYKNYTISYTKLNGNFEKKEINIYTPFNVFIKNLSIKNNNIDKTNTFLGVDYTYYLFNHNDADDFKVIKKDSNELNYFKFRIGVSINNDNPYYVGMLFNCIREIFDDLYGYNQLGIDKYEFGTEFFVKMGLSYDF